MPQTQDQEKQWADQLQQDRIMEQHFQAMRSQKDFTKAAATEHKKYRSMTAGQRATVGKNLITQGPKAISEVKRAMSLRGRGKPKHQGMWIIIFILSIMGDLFTLFPWIGTFFSIQFSLAIGFVYLIHGYFAYKFGQKAILYATAVIAELLPIIDMLPFFTTAAIINYVLIAEREHEEES